MVLARALQRLLMPAHRISPFSEYDLLMATPSQPSDPLVPLLKDAEEELRRRLEETCAAEAENISTQSSAEIRRLEDALLAAAVAAEQTIALRRHIARQPSRNSDKDARDGSVNARAAGVDRKGPASASDSEVAVPGVVGGVREFHDDTGRAWRAWLVTPGAWRAGRTTDHLMGQYHEGWICFEAIDSSARRRLPCQRSIWGDLREDELGRLLQRAISVPERKSARPSSRPSEPEAGGKE